MKTLLLFLGTGLAILQPFLHAQSRVVLLNLQNLSQSVQSLPKISNPTSPQVKINTSLTLLNKQARGLARACRGRSDEGEEMSFYRSVQTIFQGPLFLSFYLFDEVDCGGNPSSHGYTITYDLGTGEQVDWAKYLTAKPVERVEVHPHEFLPFSVLGVQSPSLQKIYAAGWQDDEQCHLDDVEDPSGSVLTAFLLSPASKKIGLSMLPATDVFRSSAGCAREVVVGKETMDVLGVPEKIQSLLLDGK